MRRFAYTLIVVFGLLLTACGSGNGQFKLDGRFLHFNQGELYVYSYDGSIAGVDTIKVEAGRFAYEIPCEMPTTLMLVFPNFSEQPVFAEPGKSVSVKADASHLKELKVEGSKENKLMNEFREMIVSVSPPEEKRLAEMFIKDHPESNVSVFLLRKYFVMSLTPDYDKAMELLALLEEKQPKNGALIRLHAQVSGAKNTAMGKPLPNFTAKDVYGNTITSASLRAPVLVISTWASWDYNSKNMQRHLRRIRRQRGGNDMKLLSICVDPGLTDCKRTMASDTIDWPVICSGEMLDDKTLKLLGLTSVPGNIVLRNGRVVATGLSLLELEKKLESL